MAKAKFYILFFILLFIIKAAFPQRSAVSVKVQPLKEILENAASYYDVRFSYVDSLVSDVQVELPSNTVIPLTKFLDLAEKASDLRFETIDERYVILRPFRADDRVDICGQVLDEKGKGLEQASIIDALGNYSVLSDRKGNFRLSDVPYGSVFSIRHLGYRTKNVDSRTLHGSQCPQFQMKEKVSFLRPVVVNAYLSEGITKSNNKITLHPKELTLLPGLIAPDILKSIQLSPGVSNPFETITGIHVRGGSPDQNLILWNGIKTYHQGHFFGMISAFNPYVTDKVDFIKNGTSAAYGERVSSVIDIKSEENVAEDWSGGAGFNMLFANAALTVPVIKNKLSISISGRQSFTDQWQSFTYNRFSDRVFQNTKINDTDNGQNRDTNNEVFFADWNSNIIYQATPSDKILFNSLYHDNQLDFSSLSNFDTQRYEDLLSTENEGYRLQWQHKKKGKGTHFSLSSYYTRYQLRYEFKNILGSNTDISSKKNRVIDYGLHFDLKQPIATKHILNFGYQMFHNDVNYAFEEITPNYDIVLDRGMGRVTTQALYTEYNYINTDKTKLQAGLRFNCYTELEEYSWEPRLFFQQRLSPALRVNVSGEYKSQVMSQIKESVVSDLSLERQVWTLASKDKFPIIDSYQLTLGSTLDKNNWLLDIETYYKEINQITTLTFGFLNPVDNNFRLGDSRIMGLDFLVKKHLGNYKTWASYSYINTENRFEGLNDNQPFPGNWNIEHTVKWSHFYDLKKLKFSLGWLWHTGKSFTDVNAVTDQKGPIRISFQDINGNNLPDYHRLDFSVNYYLNIGKRNRFRYHMGISLLNLYNRKNLLSRELRITPSLANEFIDTRAYGLGFTPNLELRISW